MDDLEASILAEGSRATQRAGAEDGRTIGDGAHGELQGDWVPEVPGAAEPPD